jgi:amino acid permease
LFVKSYHSFFKE